LNGQVDPYFNEKQQSNIQALELYKYWVKEVNNSNNPFDISLRLAIAGNIIDFATGEKFDINQTIQRVLKANFAIDHSEYLKEEIKKAKKILYLGDNAGEIVFDKLFIETLNHPNITYVVRGNPVLNDATMEDAISTGIINVVKKVISNGYGAPSTLVDKCSKEFQEHYYDADLIISKGQGNLEGLINNNYGRNIVFLLIVKCNVIADLLKVNKGDFVVVSSNVIKNDKR
jgi:hypothetical protein